MRNAPDSILATFSNRREHYLQLLYELLRIPSISNEPEHAGDMRRAALWLQRTLQDAGMKRAEIYETGGHPAVYAEWIGPGEGRPTLLVYGHYDVQPAGDAARWLSPPFGPQVRDGNLYARGASDDKGQLFAAIAAAAASLEATSHLPINLKFLFEGEEEQASPNLASFVEKHRELLAADVAFIADYAMFDEQTPVIIYGFRGILSVEITIFGPDHVLHSGIHGGAVDNPLNVLVSMLGQLRDPATRRVLIPGFYDQVRALDARERRLLEEGPLAEVTRMQAGVPILAGEEGYTTIEWVTVRPTLDIHGIRGGYVGPGQQTIIPEQATAKLSMRLVPDQEPQEIASLLENRLRRLTPPTVRLDYRVLEKVPPVVVDFTAPIFNAAGQAFEQGFGATPIFARSGGTLPIVGVLNDVLGIPVVATGFGLPDDNWHAPNEKLALSHFYRAVETMIHFFHALREH